MQEIIEAPVNIPVRVGAVGRSLPARVTVVRATALNPASRWQTIDGWVTQGEQGCTFYTLRWPVSGRVKPSEAFGGEFSTLVPHDQEGEWRSFPVGMYITRVVAHLFTIDTSKEVEDGE